MRTSGERNEGQSTWPGARPVTLLVGRAGSVPSASRTLARLKKALRRSEIHPKPLPDPVIVHTLRRAEPQLISRRIFALRSPAEEPTGFGGTPETSLGSSREAQCTTAAADAAASVWQRTVNLTLLKPAYELEIVMSSRLKVARRLFQKLHGHLQAGGRWRLPSQAGRQGWGTECRRTYTATPMQRARRRAGGGPPRVSEIRTPQKGRLRMGSAQGSVLLY